MGIFQFNQQINREWFSTFNFFIHYHSILFVLRFIGWQENKFILETKIGSFINNLKNMHLICMQWLLKDLPLWFDRQHIHYNVFIDIFLFLWRFSVLLLSFSNMLRGKWFGPSPFKNAIVKECNSTKRQFYS